MGAIAKGVRRPESKLGPSLDLYSHVDLLLAKGRGDLDVVAQVRLFGAGGHQLQTVPEPPAV